MKALKTSIIALASALALSACGANQNDETLIDEGDSEYLQAVPELAAFELSITGDAEAEGVATEDDTVVAADDALGSIGLALEAPVADGLGRSREAIRELNQALRNFLEPIAALVRNTPPDQRVANIAVWGPVTRGTTEYRFVVRKGLLRRFGWVLQARPDGSGDEFTNVAAGKIQLGTVVRRGRGTVGVDLDAFGDVDPTVGAQGKVLAAFAHGPGGTVLSYALRDFARAGDDTPIDAAFQGVHLVGGYNRVRVAFHGNVPETATDAEELVLARVRHHRGEGGRADMIISGGDVESGRFLVVSECWAAGLGSAFRRVLDCPGDGVGGERCTELASSGDAAACLGDLAEAELPPVNPEEHMDDAESPEADLVPPDAIPSGDAAEE